MFADRTRVHSFSYTPMDKETAKGVTLYCLELSECSFYMPFLLSPTEAYM